MQRSPECIIDEGVEPLGLAAPQVRELLTRGGDGAAGGRAARQRPGAYRLLDAGRGVACLWVVSHHALGPLADAQPAIARNPVYALGLNGALGVWMFFVISGYCIANSAATSLSSGRGGWAWSRGRRIYPPCWCSAVLAAVTGWLIARGVLGGGHLTPLEGGHASLGTFLANLSLTQELLQKPTLSGVYWTLCYEVGFYAVVAGVLALCRRGRSERQMLGILHAITVASLAGLASGVWWARYPLDLWPHFGLGVLLYDVLRHGWRRGNVWVACVSVGLVLLLIAEHPVRHSELDRDGCASFITSLGFALVLLGLYRFDAVLVRSWIGRALAWVGVFSYSLYLTHSIVLTYMDAALRAIGLYPRWVGGYLVLALLTTVGVAWVFFLACERPFVRSRSAGRAGQKEQSAQAVRIWLPAGS